MRSFIIATMLTFALVACEDTTSTTTETTESEKGTTFIGAEDNSGTTITNTGTTTTTTDETTTTPENTGTVEPTEVEENNETNTVPTETEETTPEQGSDPSEPVEADPVEEQPTEEETTEVDPVEDEITLEDLTAEEFANIEILRDNIFGGLDVGKELYLAQVSLALEDFGIDNGYQILDDSQELPEVSNCPYVEFYNNQAVTTGYACEYLVDKARSEAYSKLYGTLKASRENYDPDLSEQDFWFEQGAVSGLEEARVLVRVDLKAKQLCNVNPSPVKSSEEKGIIVGRQHFINSMNNWLATNGYTADYPVMSDPIEVCQANESLLDPVFNEAMNTISQAMEQDPLCDDYVPTSSDDEIMFAQAQTDYSSALQVGIADEFALAAVKIFKVVPCNVSDPIVIDLNNNGRFDITSIENGVNFSMFGKRTTAVSWLSGDGFLFVDKNSNGIADDGTEFFGTSSEFSGGFAHLATMDTNKDGAVSVKDKGFGNLYVWADTNYDGKCTTEEVTPLTETRVTSIPLDANQYQKVSTRVNGNRVKSSIRVSTGDNRVILFGDVDLRSGIYPKLQK
tara:strand:- start:785 stop:2488 length:1704 start_codon:yes stop_codon:yes gene_type:complete